MTVAPARADLTVDFEAAIEQLPPGAREIFVLHDVEGYKHREIASMLDITSGHVEAAAAPRADVDAEASGRMMTMHEEWTDKLSDYLDGELTPDEERYAVESHLSGMRALHRGAGRLAARRRAGAGGRAAPSSGGSVGRASPNALATLGRAAPRVGGGS